ncbi:Small ubiquitinrelated modifier [Stygiomarasmius scandens]|uniref:Small ubiquitinrelated modifier n=1 Tax=Marasmiellus scandens TaxID=2682957 RepID=A0ABR1IVP7_9AGAR
MSAEPEDVKPEREGDVKPKMTLNISHDGQQVQVKVKANMSFKKIFEAAEKRFSKDPGTFKFIYDGKRIQATDTPAGLEMEDGDQIDAFLEQLGGCWYWLDS